MLACTLDLLQGYIQAREEPDVSEHLETKAEREGKEVRAGTYAKASKHFD